MTTPEVDALRALRQGDRAAALTHAEQAGPSLLGTQLARYLRADSDGRTVYDQPAAFQAFISGGGNVALYEATAQALAGAWDEFEAPSILDIGCGDGAALVPAVAQARHRPARVELVEVSDALLATARQRLAQVEPTAHRTTVQDFAAGLAGDRHWNVVEATFALHTVPFDERMTVLTRLRPYVDRIVIVEFDVPEHDAAGEEHLHFLAETYERGLAEYDADLDLVAGGFLMPVLVGQLSPGAVRVTYEQPARAWADQFARCGYTVVEHRELYPYWSSPAFVLSARAG